MISAIVTVVVKGRGRVRTIVMMTSAVGAVANARVRVINMVVLATLMTLVIVKVIATGIVLARQIVSVIVIVAER